jgi:hypothetical protein
MSLYKKDIAKAIIVVSLVAVLSIGSYSLFPDALPKMMYAVGATIQDDASAAEDFIAGIRESGGACLSISISSSIYLMFENGTEYRCMVHGGGGGVLYMTTWLIKRPGEEWHFLGIEHTDNRQVKINASGLQRFSVGWGEGSVVHEPRPGNASGVNLSWYGNYNRGNEINTTLHVNSTTTDLGTHSNNFYVLGFTLELEQEYYHYSTQDLTQDVSQGFTYINPGNISKPVYWDTGPYWATSDPLIVLPNGSSKYRAPYGCWLIEATQLSQMVGQFESASIGFEGTVWIDGNYTVTENGNARNVTMNEAKNVYFGTVDVTSENGTISTLNFDFNHIELIMFAYPQE